MAAGAGLAASTLAADITAYGIAKGAWAFQGTAAGPSATPDGYGALAYAAVTDPGRILIGSATPAGGIIPAFLAPVEGANLLFSEFEFDSQSELDATVPNGSVAFTFFTSVGGQLTGNISLTGNAYPAGPVISNFAETRDIDPGAPFTLRWNAFAGAGADDVVVVTVEADGETLLQSPFPGQPGALPGSSTSYQIPAGLGADATEVEASVAFVKVTRKVSPGIDGGTGYAAYYRATGVLLEYGGGGGGGDTTAPVLVSSTPTIGAANVATDTAVVFVFSEAMQPAVDVVWIANGSPLDGAGFQYAWSGDARTLTCTRTGGFPATTMVAWAVRSGFRDLAGNPVDEEGTAGFFTTGTGSGGGDCDEDPFNSDGVFGLNKVVGYRQATTDAPVLDAQFPPSFSAIFRAPAGFSAEGAQFTAPGKTAQALTPAFGGLFFFNGGAIDPASLDAAFPAGTYSASVTETGGGVRNLSGALPASAPPVPRVSNFAAAQSVDPTQPFALQWNAFTGAGASDYLSIEISEVDGDTVYMAPDPCENIVLPVSATQVVIPANTLVAGRSYEGRLGFFRLTQGTPQGNPPITLNLGLLSSTVFPIRTGGGVAPEAPTLSNIRLGAAGALAFDITGTPNSTVVLESSTDLRVWGTLGTVNLPGSGMATHQLGVVPDGHLYIRGRAQ